MMGLLGYIPQRSYNMFVINLEFVVFDNELINI